MVILNEKKYAEECLEKGIIDKNPYQVISILAKYYYHECGFKKKQIGDLLVDYLGKHYPRYELNEMQWLSAVERLAVNAKKEHLFETSGVKITKNEINIIRDINDTLLETFVFTSLCLAKLYNLKNPSNNGWINTETNEVFNMAHISCSIFKQDVVLNKLCLLGLAEFPKKNDNLNFRITFAEEDGAEELFISDFRELGYEYLNYLNGGFIRCADCGILTRTGKTNQKKYCEKHGSDKKKQKKPKEKTTFCVDCGKPIEVSSKNNKTDRCIYCYETYRKEYYRENKRKQRESKKMSTVEGSFETA